MGDDRPSTTSVGQRIDAPGRLNLLYTLLYTVRTPCRTPSNTPSIRTNLLLSAVHQGLAA